MRRNCNTNLENYTKIQCIPLNMSMLGLALLTIKKKLYITYLMISIKPTSWM